MHVCIVAPMASTVDGVRLSIIRPSRTEAPAPKGSDTQCTAAPAASKMYLVSLNLYCRQSDVSLDDRLPAFCGAHARVIVQLDCARDLTSIYGDRVTIFHSRYDPGNRTVFRDLAQIAECIPTTFTVCAAYVDSSKSLLMQAHSMGVRCACGRGRVCI